MNWNSPKLYWLRWILVLPAALVAYLVIGIFVALLIDLQQWFWRDDSYSWVSTIMLPIFRGAASGYYLITAGCFIAPLFKKETALILLVIMAMLMGIGIFFHIYYKHGWWQLTEYIATIVAGIVAYIEINRKNYEEIILKDIY